MRHLVLGLGEVGRPLQELLGADGWDATHSQNTPEDADVLHIAFPYSEHFVVEVCDYRILQRPDVLTVIHSTVPIGTTEQIPNAVHSPVFGRHASMLYDMKRYPKLLGGDTALTKLLIDDFRAARLQPCNGFTSDQTEAIKLIDLATYGAQIATQRMAVEVLTSVGLTDNWLRSWTEEMNGELDPLLCRPVITGEGPIGGHCVTAGIRLLNEQYPHDLLKGVLRYSA